jgi:hypothetical protein
MPHASARFHEENHQIAAMMTLLVEVAKQDVKNPVPL